MLSFISIKFCALFLKEGSQNDTNFKTYKTGIIPNTCKPLHRVLES